MEMTSVHDTRAWLVEALDLPAAQEKGRWGREVHVALLDAGVADLPAFPHVDRRWDDGEEIDKPPYDWDARSHGTSMASVIAARPMGAEQALVGIAPEATLTSYTVSTGDGYFSGPVGRALASALSQANLVCCALALPTIDAALDRVLEDARAAGVPVIAAAGDSRSTPQFPRPDQPLLIAGGHDHDGQLIPAHRWGDWVCVSAPGVDVPAWTRTGEPTPSFNGTSAAAAVVTGVAALALSLARERGDAVFELVRRQLSALMRASAADPSGARRIDPVALLHRIEEIHV